MKRINAIILSFAIISVIVSCAGNPYAPTNRVHKKQIKTLTKELKVLPPPPPGTTAKFNYAEDWVGTTNFSLRRPNLVVIHHTAQNSVDQTLKTFTLPRTQVSSHYVIGRNGEIYQMLNDLYRAWHGGSGQWGSNTDINSASIGIELDNNGFEEFSPLQIASLLNLLEDLKTKYKIPAANFIGHSDIAPTRKNDPNRTFPWKLLALKGFGLWYDEPIDIIGKPLEGSSTAVGIEPSEFSSVSNDSVPTSDSVSQNPELLDVSPAIALKIIGYDVTDLPAAIKAFKLHFIQTEVDTNLTDHDLRVLNNLYKKYL
ncbi:N-acetylmuramoyl-L-alanine amidase [Gelidibacter maritimus]|uniref:N-acetylmuramoyl-L-alanine amidase n=1 Tax=Gelidibacter maritimus TaxID=2761487 RepID=A0A7W2M4B7_9FLAO|nr:N-acetylmuramoyl-L-alanine amidase [Gelidibacter maritimus]MBA6152372.1 N-acetylmuramoyl-L-alanine amidase [Gelidibacter maritimus]